MKPTSAHQQFQSMRFAMGDRSLEIIATVAEGQTDFHGLIDGSLVISDRDAAPVLTGLLRIARAEAQIGRAIRGYNARQSGKSDFGAVIVTMRVG